MFDTSVFSKGESFNLATRLSHSSTGLSKVTAFSGLVRMPNGIALMAKKGCDTIGRTLRLTLSAGCFGSSRAAERLGMGNAPVRAPGLHPRNCESTSQEKEEIEEISFLLTTTDDFPLSLDNLLSWRHLNIKMA